jgi:hypothetical protein
MMKYEQATMASPMREFIMPVLALVGSLPLAHAKIYISPETTNATVTRVPIKNVADKTISWTKSPTEVASPGLVMLFLMPSVS